MFSSDLTLNPDEWKIHDRGNYNCVFINADESLVFKTQLTDDKTDEAERSVRLWNEINPHIKPPAKKATLMYKGRKLNGWICPFIQGIQATDEEIAQALIEIFNRTGRIVVDALSRKNFIKRASDGKIVCVDVGMALQLEIEEEKIYSDTIRREHSTVSSETWNDEAKNTFDSFFKKTSEAGYSKTINTIKSLLFIKQHRPDIFNVSFLGSKASSKLVNELANAYDGHKASAESVRASLNQIQPPTFENVKQSCIIALQRYIKARGSLISDPYNNDERQFKPSLTTRLFRDTTSTIEKANHAIGLIENIKNAKTFDDIKKHLELLAEDHEELFRADWFTSGLAKSIRQCIEILRQGKPDFVVRKMEELKNTNIKNLAF